MRRACAGTSATILPSCTQTSRTSPAMPLAGSYTRPPAIRSIRGALRSRPARPRRPGGPPASGARSGSGTPSIRWTVPGTSMPSAAVANATRAACESPWPAHRRPPWAARAGDRRRPATGARGDRRPRRARRRPRRARAARRRRARRGRRAGEPRAKLTAAVKPVCQASTSSAPRALPSPRSPSVTAWRSRLRSRTSESSASAVSSSSGAVDARRRGARRAGAARGRRGRRAAAPRSDRDQRDAGDQRAQRPQRLEVVGRIERDERVGLLGGRGALRVDDDERRDPRAARSSRRRSSRRGWVTAGSARQATTSSARSRISPKVAVLAPIAW